LFGPGGNTAPAGGGITITSSFPSPTPAGFGGFAHSPEHTNFGRATASKIRHVPRPLSPGLAADTGTRATSFSPRLTSSHTPPKTFATTGIAASTSGLTGSSNALSISNGSTFGTKNSVPTFGVDFTTELIRLKKPSEQ
jgi:hypothetical protein